LNAATIVVVKSEVFNALLTARTLFDTARRQCLVRDRHIASAGLIVLQDAVELVLYACLIEKGADETKALESFTFDQLIGEIKRIGLVVIKSGTLKAMNKQRVLIKHHAQLAEPAAVQEYYKASLLATDSLLTEIIGKPLRQVVLADAVSNPELKALIDEATMHIDDRQYMDALIATRKALFLAVEVDYDIRKWENYDPSQGINLLLGFGKAPYYARNKSWIQEHVSNPLDYIQLDHSRIDIEMMELGIDPTEFFNVWRLTPKVYRLSEGIWAVDIEPRTETAATENNARYCLDVVVSILLNQQLRKLLVRSPDYRIWKVRLLRSQPVLKRAALDAEHQGIILAEGDSCIGFHLVLGFDGKEQFVRVFSSEIEGKLHFVEGYLPLEACELEVQFPQSTSSAPSPSDS
jgi:hypothetical protein